MLGNTEGRRRRGQQRTRWLDGSHWLNAHEFEQTLEDGERQESLAGCSPWGRKESDMTEQLNNQSKIGTNKLFIKKFNKSENCTEEKKINFIELY